MWLYIISRKGNVLKKSPHLATHIWYEILCTYNSNIVDVLQHKQTYKITECHFLLFNRLKT